MDSFLTDDLSVMDSVNVDGVVFFGPITTKELKVREKFLNDQRKAQANLISVSSDTMEGQKDISDSKANSVLEAKTETNNSSVYESFSVDSKYESFEDSLYEAADLNRKEINISQFLSDQVHVNMRKTSSKQRQRAGYFCDSLEDIHSLVSNAEKFSTSEEIENVNILEKSVICEDSLRNDIHLENRNPSSNEQYFDDDSLAILEFEKAFDDSLDESDFVQLNRIDSVAALRLNSDSGAERMMNEPSCGSRNHFETSIEIIYEDVENLPTGTIQSFEEQRNNSSDYSQSLSEYMSRDSLEEKQGLPKQDFPNAKSNSNGEEKDLKNVMLRVSNDVDIPVLSSGLIKHNAQSENNENCKKNEIISSAFKILPLTHTQFVSIDKGSSLKAEPKNRMSVEVNSNDTIWIDDSFCSQANVPNNKKDDSLVALKNSECENKNSNDTIWIEDSFCAHPDIVSTLKMENSPVNETESANQRNVEVGFMTDSDVCVDPIGVTLPPGLIKRKRTPSFKAKEQIKNHSLYVDVYTQKPNYLAISSNSTHSIKTLKNSPVEVDAQMTKNLANSPSVSSRPLKTLKNSPGAKSPAGCNTVTRKLSLKGKTKTPVSAHVPSSCSHNEHMDTHMLQKRDQVDGVSVLSSLEDAKPLSTKIHSKAVLARIETKNTDSNYHHKIKNPKSTNLVTEKCLSDLVDSQKPKSLTIKTLKNSPVANEVDAQMKSQCSYTQNMHSKLDTHDKKLLQALDLHDMSYSFSESVLLQSRDSIMPLNLCTRDKCVLNSESKENIPFIFRELKTPDLKLTILNTSKPKSSSKTNKGTPSANYDNKTPIHSINGPEVKKSGSKIPSTKIPIRKVDNFMPTPVNQKNIKQNLKSNSCDGRSVRSPVVEAISSDDHFAKEVCKETPQKHHFCMVRNSISRVPKSAPKAISKKFQYIESPVAKYIGSAQVYTPVKSPHHVKGKILANILPANQATSKAGCNAFKNLPEIPMTLKMGKKY